MPLFSRSCSNCGEKPTARVAPAITGRSGDAVVELANFPYEACSCGQRARWAFDPGLEFSTQLFYDGFPYAKGQSCARCNGPLGESAAVELRAEARLDGFEPIGFRTVLPGYRCDACGLDQAPPGAFDTGGHGPFYDGAAALEQAVATLGLR